jgi:hypothetical protein
VSPPPNSFVFLAVLVVSKENRRLVLPRTSCYFLIWDVCTHCPTRSSIRYPDRSYSAGAISGPQPTKQYITHVILVSEQYVCLTRRSITAGIVIQGINHIFAEHRKAILYVQNGFVSLICQRQTPINIKTSNEKEIYFVSLRRVPMFFFCFLFCLFYGCLHGNEIYQMV